MKRRHLYILMFSIPALLASIMLSVLLIGALIGALWLFVLGDSRWPSSVDSSLTAVFFLACAVTWLVLLGVAYAVGKRQEKYATFNVKHALAAAGVTAALALVAFAHQWGNGNIGPRSDTVACADFCQARGYDGSGTSPRNSMNRVCSCFSSSGLETIHVLLDSLDYAN